MDYVDAWFPGPTNRNWIADDGWIGVRVVEGPVRQGVNPVAVAVEPGARAVISGEKVPWRLKDFTPEVAARAASSAVFTTERQSRGS